MNTTKSHDQSTKVGVSGASGQLGKSVVSQLLKHGREGSIIAITRSPGSVTAGVTAVRGDYDEPDTLIDAYQGLDSLLIIPSADLRVGVRERQYKAAIDAAVAAGVRKIVLMSAVGIRRVSGPSIFAAYWEAEQHLMKSASNWTILRMSYYSESFVEEAKSSLNTGVLIGLGKSRVSFVSREDVAAAAAGILLGEGHSGAIYHATGPQSLTGPESAALVSEASGGTIVHSVITEEQLREGLTQAGLPAEMTDAVVDIKTSFSLGGFDIVTGDVEKLSGQQPVLLREILTESFKQS